MNNSDFYVGQEVICINDKPFPSQNGTMNPLVKKGNTYLILGLRLGMCCNSLDIDIGLTHISTDADVVCTCGKIYKSTSNIWYLSASRFKPKDQLETSIEFLEIKKEQLC